VNGPDWLYRVNVSFYKKDIHGEFAFHRNFYEIDLEEAREVLARYRDRPECSAILESASIGDFYRVPDPS
jgi:hypothetical protein